MSCHCVVGESPSDDKFLPRAQLPGRSGFLVWLGREFERGFIPVGPYIQHDTYEAYGLQHAFEMADKRYASIPVRVECEECGRTAVNG